MLQKLPQSDLHSMVKLTICHPQGMSEMTLDDSHLMANIDLPPGVNEDDVEIIAEFVGRDGQVDVAMRPMLLKEKVEHEDEQEQHPADAEGHAESKPEDGSEAKADSEPQHESGPTHLDGPADGHVPESSVAPAGHDDAQVGEPSEQVGEASHEQEADAQSAPQAEVNRRKKSR